MRRYSDSVSKYIVYKSIPYSIYHYLLLFKFITLWSWINIYITNGHIKNIYIYILNIDTSSLCFVLFVFFFHSFNLRNCQFLKRFSTICSIIVFVWMINNGVSLKSDCNTWNPFHYNGQYIFTQTVNTFVNIFIIKRVIDWY